MAHSLTVSWRFPPLFLREHAEVHGDKRRLFASSACLSGGCGSKARARSGLGCLTNKFTSPSWVNWPPPQPEGKTSWAALEDGSPHCCRRFRDSSRWHSFLNSPLKLRCPGFGADSPTIDHCIWGSKNLKILLGQPQQVP